jgi:hypothetical protein
MHQPLFGASIPLIMFAVIALYHRGRAPLWSLVITPPAMLAGAIWAIIPDVPRLVGAHALYQKLANAPWTNIFFWHYTIDQIETTTLDRWTPLFNSLFTIMLLLLLAVAWHTLRCTENDAEHEPQPSP